MSAQRSVPRQGAKKRPSGSGSIYQRKDGKWMAAVTFGDGRRRTRTATTREVAEVRLRELLAERDAGLVGERPTVQDWLDAWFARKQMEGLQPSTLNGYADDIRLWICPAIGDIDLHRLDRSDVASLYLTMVTAGRAKSRVQRVSMLLRQAIDEAVREELVMRNVAGLVKVPRMPGARRLPALSPAEVRSCLEVARKHGELARFVLAFSIGARQGELLALEWSNVDLSETPSITILQTRARHKWEHGACGSASRHTPAKCPSRRELKATGPTKTEAGVRLIPIPHEVADVLREHRARIVEMKMAFGPAFKGDAVFPAGPRGGFRSATSDRDRWSAILVEALGHSMGTHAARRTAVTMLLEESSPMDVAAIIGHASTAILYTYARPRREQQGKAIETTWAKMVQPERGLRPAASSPHRWRGESG